MVVGGGGEGGVCGEKALFKLIEVCCCSHTGAVFTHFLFRHFLPFCGMTIHGGAAAVSEQLRLALGVFPFLFFLKTLLADTVICPFLSESRRARARDPGRATEPPALNQRDARCVISHTNTRTQITRTHKRGGGTLFAKTVLFFFLFLQEKETEAQRTAAVVAPLDLKLHCHWIETSWPVDQ